MKTFGFVCPGGCGQRFTIESSGKEPDQEQLNEGMGVLLRAILDHMGKEHPDVDRGKALAEMYNALESSDQSRSN